MITATQSATQPADDWRTALRSAYRDTEGLLTALGLASAELEVDAHSAFPLRVPAAFVRRMRPEDPADPLLLQVLPLRAETLNVPGYSTDPVAELGRIDTPGLVRKYQGRALLIATAACAIHCRYCFRRHFPYAENQAGREQWAPALQAIAADASLHEVILSGGDPLSLDDAKLGALIRQLSEIPHISTLRIHTRQPVVLPQRVTVELCRVLAGANMRVVVVIHSNHPAEIDAEVAAGLMALRGTGALLLNQSVLLRGVNDSVECLSELSFKLLDNHVLPYYLHLLDPVAGAAHFALPQERAIAIHDGLANRLPGYLVPKLVREIPGAPRKMSVGGDGEIS